MQKIKVIEIIDGKIIEGKKNKVILTCDTLINNKREKIEIIFYDIDKGQTMFRKNG